MTHRRQASQTALWKALVALLQLEVRNDRCEVGVAGPLPQAVQGSLYMIGAGLDCRHGVRHSAAGVVVAMDANRGIVSHVRLNIGDDG